MKLKARSGIALGIVFAASALAQQAAQANPFHDIMDNYFARSSNGSYSRNSSNGQNGAIQSSLDEREATLRQSIATALNTGKINHSQAAELNAELSNIDAQEYSAARTNGYQYNETASLVSALGAVDTRLQNYMLSGTNTGFGNPAPGPNSYYRPASGSASLIRNRIRSLRDRINRESDAGNISSQESSNLTSRLDTVSQQYRPSWRGYTSNANDVQAQAQLSGIEQRLAYDLAHNDNHWGNHRYHHDDDHNGNWNNNGNPNGGTGGNDNNWGNRRYDQH